MNQLEGIIERHAMTPGTIELAKKIRRGFAAMVDPKAGEHALDELLREDIRVA